MIINKIYSNKPELMRPISFEQGLNVIYGDVEPKKNDEDEHNIGKTSLAHLINFLLLKQLKDTDYLKKKKDKFKGWEFFLEITLSEGRYLTIKRGVDKNTKISFKEHSEKNQEYIEEKDWDHENISIGSKKSTNAVDLLEQYLNFDEVISEYSVRSFLPYLLRTQTDYTDVFELSNFKSGPHINWKPMLFHLLGFDDVSLMKKYLLEKEIETIKTSIKLFKVDKGDNDIYSLQALLAAKKSEKRQLQEQLTKLDFFLAENKVNTDLVEDIEAKINRDNHNRYVLSLEIKRINQSLENEVVFNFEEIKQLFKEAEIYFSDSLKKDYDDLISFNTNLSQERTKYLKQELTEKKKLLKEVQGRLVTLNSDKASALEFLTEKRTSQKYSELKEKESKIDRAIIELEIQIGSYSDINKQEEQLERKREELKEIKEKIVLNMNEMNSTLTDIQGQFTELTEKILGYPSIFSPSLNSTKNVNFVVRTPHHENIGEYTSKSEGYTATRMQCLSFVISLLIHYSNKNYYHFSYFDGIFESAGNKPRRQLIKTMRDVCNKHNIQFIVTVIKSDVPEGVTLTEDEKAITLSKDKNLFGIDF